MRPTSLKINKKLSFWLIGLLAIAGCDLQKESGFNRQMQNLTAHYNIIFNANQIIAQKQEATAVSFVDTYDRFLSVYPDTAAKTKAPDKDLESVVVRANIIISDKSQSHYLGDAYLLLGKTNYLQTNFFNAIEFLNYVIRSYPKQQNLVQEARVWKARSLMRINQMMLADTTLDTALHSIFPKEKNIADIYATRLQFDIYAAHYIDGEEMAKQAIKFSGDVNHKLRWTYILAQLQEQNHKPEEAAISYTRVVNSNASFEMAFNASLNRIRIQEKQAGEKLTRIQSLRRLLKDDKNKDFIDQIYFQIGDLYLVDGKIDDAILNFKLSVRKSTKNLNQKGLSYLRLADINFKNKANYPLAKKYYDSTLTSLSPNYPGYPAIYKKSSNLQLLTDRLLIISHEDTLQMLAKLNPPDRDARIKAMAKAQIDAQKTIANNALNAQSNSQLAPAAIPGNYASTFYFYNSTAVSQGFTDFKRIWGNRPLSDNWRRSVKAPTETNNAQVASTIQNLNASSLPNRQKTTNDVIAEKIQQDIDQQLPLTPQLLTQSNTRILNAYTDIANFYRDILDDKKEAILTFEQILKRFPDNANRASNYYNLYRLYSDIDPAKSNYYKNLILKQYPESNFAKVIQDPDFNQKLNDRNAEYTAFYNQLFDMILKRNYTEAAKRAGEMLSQYPDNILTPQVYYLRAIALGHTQTVDPFRIELQDIADKFPDDRLITPLVKQHLQFIDANITELKQRPIVLVDSDPNEIPFLLRSIPIDRNYTPPNHNIAKQPVPPAKEAAKSGTPPATASTIKPGLSATAEGAKEAPSIFSLRDSTNYYFVVNVSTNTVSLAPSRFGIGQFNRANLPQGTLVKHQLKAVGTNQLIYVGRFSSLFNVKDYARAIIPLLPQIMKVPADKYKFFIITQENLDKLADQKTLDSYFDFYQKKY